MSDLPVFSGLDRVKLDYLAGGLVDIQGWLHPGSALYLAGLETAQRGRVEGGIAEIGVHCGKLFHALALGVPEGDEVRALDIWDHQQANENGEPEQVRSIFERHLARHGLTDRVELTHRSSLELREAGFVEPGRRYRLFSVDGGHDADIAKNDLQLAEETLVPGGIVAYDDFTNPHFLGVLTGIVDYLADGGTLVPFALIPNKLLLSDREHVAENRALMRELFEPGMSKPDVELFGAVIDVYADVPFELEATDGARAPLWQVDTSEATLAAQLRSKTLEAAATHRLYVERNAELAAERRAHRETQKKLRAAEAARGRSLAERAAPKVPKPLYAPARAIYRLIRGR